MMPAKRRTLQQTAIKGDLAGFMKMEPDCYPYTSQGLESARCVSAVCSYLELSRSSNPLGKNELLFRFSWAPLSRLFNLIQ